MADESLNSLPGKFFNKSQTGANLQSGPTVAYYANSNASASVYFPASFVSKDSNIASWVAKVVSTTPASSSNGGSNLIAAAKDLDLNTITGQTGFVGTGGQDLKIAFVPIQPNQQTHNVSTTGGTFYTSSFPNVSGTLPHNALSLIGQSNESASSSGSSSSGPSLGNSSNSFNLTVTSAAVVNTPGQYAAYVPSTTTGGSGTTSGGCAYVALINGGDFQASMNSAGLTATYLQSQGYSNVNLTPTTNIAFNGANTDIFDILNWDLIEQGWYNNTDWIIVGTNSQTGLYNVYQTQGVSGFTSNVLNSAQNFPTNNYNDVIDNPNLASATPSMPFVFMADYNNIVLTNEYGVNGYGNMQSEQTMNATIQQCLGDFGVWIAYNTSVGSDALGHNPALDPLGSNASPALFAQNPNSIVPNTLISATSNFMQFMTIADALQIKDICVVQDGGWVFTGKQPDWVDSIMPVIASNYGYDYLPTPVGEYRPNGFTGIEYAKAQIVCIYAGLGMSENPAVIPSNPGYIYLPFNNPGYTNQPLLPGASKVSSGMRYFVPYDTDGKLAHYAWPEPDGCPQFETPGTPLQLLNNMNLLNNSGTFNASDTNYNAILNSILTIVQQMNPSITLNDLTTVLNSANVDLNQTVYLIYNSSVSQNHGLQMVSTLPTGTTYQPPDGTQAQATYNATYQISSAHQDDFQHSNTKTLIDTAAASYSTVQLPNGQTVCPAPYGDCKVHASPYNVIWEEDPNTWNEMSATALAQDTVTLIPSSGANNNHGTVYFSETVGATLSTAAMN